MINWSDMSVLTHVIIIRRIRAMLETNKPPLVWLLKALCPNIYCLFLSWSFIAVFIFKRVYFHCIYHHVTFLIKQNSTYSSKNIFKWTLIRDSEKITFSSVLRGNSLNTCKRLWTLYQYQDKIPFQFYILSIGRR